MIPAAITGRVREHGGFEMVITPFAGVEDSRTRSVKFWHAVEGEMDIGTRREGRREEGMDDTVRFGGEVAQRVSGRGAMAVSLFRLNMRGGVREVVRTQALTDWRRRSRGSRNRNVSIVGRLGYRGGWKRN